MKGGDKMLSQKKFFQITAVIFGLVTLLHVLRLFYGWNVSLGDFSIPMAVSIIAPFVSAYLTYNAFKLAK